MEIRENVNTGRGDESKHLVIRNRISQHSEAQKTLRIFLFEHVL